MKVFELAKELNTNSLELVEELNRYGFKVNNHIADLSSAQIKKFHKKREESLNQPDPVIKQIKATLINKKDLQRQKKQAAQNQKDFPKKCEQIIKRLASYLADSGSSSDFADYAEEQLTPLIKANPDAFSKKAQSLL